jgi:hypothetical protein
VALRDIANSPQLKPHPGEKMDEVLFPKFMQDDYFDQVSIPWTRYTKASAHLCSQHVYDSAVQNVLDLWRLGVKLL